MPSPFKLLLAGVALAASALPAVAATNVSINIGQPGFYGRLDIGDFGPPPVIYERPVIVREVRHVRVEPVYLRVPAGHRKNWKRYCGRYDACGRPVMFVRDDWYTNTYAPRWRERHHRVDHHHGRPEHHDRRDHHDRHDRHGRDRHDDRGHGHGNGHGNGHGRGH